MKIGELLKQARLEKGWTLDEISKDLYIQRRYLEALEAGKYEIIPGEAYQRAYFRKYAEHLGIADYIDSLTRPHGTMEKQKNDKEHDILGGQWDTARITRVSLKIGIPVLIVLLLIGARANFAKRAEPEPEESVQSTRPIEVVPYEENRSWHLPSEPGYENPVQAIDDNTHELRLTASGECWVELKTRDSQLIPGRNLVLQPSFWLLIIILTTFGWMGITYYVRGEFYREKSKDGAFYAPNADLTIWANGDMNGGSSYFPIVTSKFAMNGTATLYVKLDWTAAGYPAPEALKTEGKITLTD